MHLYYARNMYHLTNILSHSITFASLIISSTYYIIQIIHSNYLSSSSLLIYHANLLISLLHALI
jgi:hypothetical protein